MITLVALCAVGAEKIVSNEIKQLGYKPIGNSVGRVIYTAESNDALFRSNLCLRTADRVYLQLTSFFAIDFDALFDGVKAVDWQDYFKKNVCVVVDKVRTYKSVLSSEHSVQKITHKAIYSKLGEKWNMSVLPESGETATVRIYIEKDTVSVLLDLSGKPLHKRGYRTSGGEAPIRETLASILLQIMFWRRKTPLHDAFCGSGTIPIEATLFAFNVAPGFGRDFALEHLAIFDSKRAREIKQEEAAKIRTDCIVRITGTDKDPAVVECARLNAEHACTTAGRALQLIGSDMRVQRPDFECADFSELSAPYDTGLLLSNPPYGERLGDSETAEALYDSMKSLFTVFPGWDMGFITSNENFEKIIARPLATKKKLKSGNLETQFYAYRSNQGR